MLRRLLWRSPLRAAEHRNRERQAGSSFAQQVAVAPHGAEH
ncbi:hypothetical protein ACWEJ6_54715 [Nonomuraea sp. NPDC004702]